MLVGFAAASVIRGHRVDNAVEMMERAKTNVEQLERSKDEKS